jgi:hypothetical protein
MRLVSVLPDNLAGSEKQGLQQSYLVSPRTKGQIMNPALRKILWWMRKHWFRTAIIIGLLIHFIEKLTGCQVAP